MGIINLQPDISLTHLAISIRNLDLLINFADRAKNPSIGTARQMLHILQSHYPERLGFALIINVPMLVNAFFKIIMPFVDPVTRNKVKFNPDIFEDGFFEKDQVMKEWWGGDREFEWDHEQYWPALVRTCAERKAAQMQRWRELGAKVGISEWEMKTNNAEQSHLLAQQSIPEKSVEIETAIVTGSATVEA